MRNKMCDANAICQINWWAERIINGPVITRLGDEFVKGKSRLPMLTRACCSEKGQISAVPVKQVRQKAR